MTLIITHANGFTSCFTKNGDGLKQRALIDTGGDGLTPEQLAAFGEELAAQYNWLNQPAKGILSGLPYGTTPKPLALPSAKPKQNNGGILQPGEPAHDERRKVILDYLLNHPNSSLRQIIEGMGLQYETRISGRWNHYMNQMINDRLIKKKRNGLTFMYMVR